MNCLIWNIWGLRGSESQQRLHAFVKEKQIKVLAVLEPMIDLDPRFMTRRLGFSGVISNLSGHIWVFFAADVRAECVFDHDQFLHIRISASFLPTEIFCSFVYARCDYVQRRDLWASLLLVKLVLGPWLVGGDFNVVRDESECLGSRGGRLLPMEEFNTFILDSGLIDAGFEGSSFTWTNKTIWKRLDRNVRLNWNLPCILSGMPRLFAKLKHLKHHLQWWNRDVFCNIFDGITEAERAVRSAETVCEADLSDANWTLLSDRNENLARITAMEHLIQQSGALFFQDLLTGEPSALDCPDFSGFPSVISEVENDSIAAIPSLEELRATVFSIHPDSIAGPDGFSSAFFQHCLEIVHQDVFGSALDFFQGSPMPQGFTATTVTLIPKVEGARAWSDFRPISLCNVTNKIISKLLYSWLRDVVERLVFPKQSVFIPGGLRQDDPLSPLLFILGAEYLSRGLDRLYLQHPALRYRSDCDILISHLAYADDVIIFASGGSRGMQRLVDFLHHYENCSGQRVNAAKSSLILPPRCSGRLRSRILRITGFAEGHLPLKYLGVPVYRGNRTCSLFEPLLQSGSSLWARFLFRKYCRLDAPACVPARGLISPIWRRLLRIRPRTEPGIRWRVGLGDVSFWDDTWLGDAPLSSRCVVRGGRDVRLSQFLFAGSWDFDRLGAVVAPSVAEEIVLIPVLSREPDLARWIHSSDGAFSARSAWELIRQRNPSSDIFRPCWGRLHRTANVRWLRPPSRCFKLNVDGSSRGIYGDSAAGGVVRDDSRRIVLLFRGFLYFPVLLVLCELDQTLASTLSCASGHRHLHPLCFAPLGWGGSQHLPRRCFSLDYPSYLAGVLCRLLLARRLLFLCFLPIVMEFLDIFSQWFIWPRVPFIRVTHDVTLQLFTFLTAGSFTAASSWIRMYFSDWHYIDRRLRDGHSTGIGVQSDAFTVHQIAGNAYFDSGRFFQPWFNPIPDL
ncbi:uncharacterized protein LOC142504979 [Primulina tabacum]|uniref:uncharacterized protein LOC142504979 n=1 Tax=Primulina tabacum TaxID=48773 RepID=UPI003F5974AB